jgi:hypothetical protein
MAATSWDPWYQWNRGGGQETLSENARQFNERMNLWNQYNVNQQQAGTGLNSLINTYNQSFAAAQSANLQRNNQQLGLVDQVTSQRAADIAQQYHQRGADVFQNLARLGMANTTVAPTMESGVMREKQAALNNLTDQMLGTKLGVAQNFKYAAPDAGITQSAIQALTPKPFSF